ncbi:alpha/beta fold hydrolase [Nocardiopsis sp. MG754419]|uniref:alpha/beta fold hydrolase n=1 Tax=Nocardiopsis sp. MG754419 TaxID=2259865 RepID=UPI001BAB0A25|nr:alpha/beta fold hydrolase [Nocardiopsis sp. MG754419]MBR8745435.1 alpha/beta hydrolase [Nocardiopsis sp. MG754419]
MPFARSAALTAASGLLLTAVAVPASAAPDLEWRLCSDIARGWDEDDDRTLCASVPVPLDHDDPDGRTIEIAVTRVPAAEENAYPILFNPGGPGMQGVTMPGHILDSSAADLGLRHDLVGFDTRGVGYSGALECDHEMTEPDPDLDAEGTARHVAEEQSRMNGVCHAHDPELVASLSVENVARDMELVRAALGAETIGYYGVSWGSLLGATYRSLHDDRVEAMLLDSVVSPDSSLTRLEAGQVEAGEEVFHRFTAWLAEHHDVYGRGSDAALLREEVFALRDELAEEPRTGPDGTVADAFTVTALLATPEREWPANARALGTLLDGGVPEVEFPQGRAFGTGWDAETDGATAFAQIALFCNDSDSPRDFDEVWRNRTELAERFPAVGTLGFYDHLCVGWPEEGEGPDLRRGQSPLQLVGHAKEMVTPHIWATDMREVIGGEVMTVDDDGHGTLSDLDCATAAVDFFATGRTTTEVCPGPPPPTPES